MKWESIKLGDIAVAKGGSTDPRKSPDQRFDLYSIPAYDSGSPEVTIGSGIGSSKKNVKPRDVLLSRIVPHIRRAWIVKNKSANPQIASGEWIIFRSKEIAPEFLRHYLISDPFHSQFMQTVSGVGGSLLRARPAQVYDIDLPLPFKNGKPDLDEQKRIAAILDKADAIRRKRRQALQLTDDFLRSLFLDMFGDPVTNPKGWEVKALSSEADVITGFAFPSNTFVERDKGVALCRGINVGVGKFNWKDRCDWRLPVDPKLNTFFLQKDDVILALDRPWISEGLKIAKVTDKDLPALLVQRVARIRAKSPERQCFIYFLLNHRVFERHCKPTETTIPHISPVELKKFPVVHPDRDAVVQFYHAVCYAQNVKEKLREDKCNCLFQSLQQRAFKGEL